MAPSFEGFDGGFDGAIGGDHEDGGFAVARADFAQDVHTGAVGHHQVEQDQVVGARFDLAQAFGAVGGEIDVVAFHIEEGFEAFADIEFVVHDENAAFIGSYGEFGC